MGVSPFFSFLSGHLLTLCLTTWPFMGMRNQYGMGIDPPPVELPLSIQDELPQSFTSTRDDAIVRVNLWMNRMNNFFATGYHYHHHPHSLIPPDCSGQPPTFLVLAVREAILDFVLDSLVFMAP